MSPFSVSNLALMMGSHASPREIEKLVERLNILPSDSLERISSSDVRVAAIQLMRKSYTTLADYIVDMNLYIADAVNRRAHLVCFPAFTGLLPVTFLPQFATALPRLRPLAATGMPDVSDMLDTLGYFGEFTYDIYFNTMSALAQKHRIYIMAGSTLCYDNDKLRHRAFLFNDSGDMIGFQDKLSTNSLEKALSVEPASELKIFETPFGSVAILTCDDTHYFEPARIAKNLGARLLLSPNILTREYTPVEMALGLNMRTQENFIYGVQSMLVGDTGLGFQVEGTGCVFSPNELLMRKNGVMAQTSGRFEPDIICAKISYDRLEDTGSPYTYDKNSELLSKYISYLY